MPQDAEPGVTGLDDVNAPRFYAASVTPRAQACWAMVRRLGQFGGNEVRPHTTLGRRIRWRGGVATWLLRPEAQLWDITRSRAATISGSN